MKTLCMDTTHKHLVIGLYEDEKCLASVNELAWKRQSEKFFPALMECMEKAGWSADDLDQVVVTKGPGSYTGERIAMTIAKVLCTTKHIDLYTISTFLMYAGTLENVEVILDARSKRAYTGWCHQGQLVKEEVRSLEAVNEDLNAGANIIGDIDLLGQEVCEYDFVANMMAVKPFWEKVENIHALTPHYLKSEEELVK